jgi:hypothetical protein
MIALLLKFTPHHHNNRLIAWSFGLRYSNLFIHIYSHRKLHFIFASNGSRSAIKVLKEREKVVIFLIRVFGIYIVYRSLNYI